PLDARPINKTLPAQDRSLDVARELGRLLAAADSRFLRKMLVWRHGNTLATTEQTSAAVMSAALAPTKKALPMTTANAVLDQATQRRTHAANRWDVPKVAHAQTERLRKRRAAVNVATPNTENPLSELRRERDRIVARRKS